METHYLSTMEAKHNASKPSDAANCKLDTWNSIYDPSSFKPPEKRVLAPGLVRNPVIPGYVFGKGLFGKGYYSLKCRESYDVLLDRIDIMIKVAKEEKRKITMLMIIGCIWVCLPCHYAHYNKKIAKLEEVKEFAKLRRNASGPDVKIELPDILEERMNKNIRNRKKYKVYGYYDDSAYYTDAVSCGATADGGFYTGGGGFYAGPEVREGGGFIDILWGGNDGGECCDDGNYDGGGCDGGDCGGGD